MLQPQGILPAILTPFTEDYRLDEARLREHLREVSPDSGGLVGPAVASELPSLTFAEWQRWTDIMLEVAHEAGLPGWAYFGTESFEKTIPYAEYAIAAGADGLMLLAPYYHRYGQEAGYSYFRDFITRYPDKPFIIYPSLQTSNPFLPKTIARLAEFDNVVGLKLSIGFSLHHIVDIARLTEDLNFTLIPGSLTAVYPLQALGITATFSPESSLAHHDAVALWKAIQSGDEVRAKELHTRFVKAANTILDPLVHFHNISAAKKVALELLGRSVGPVRRPLMRPSEREIEALRCMLEEVGMAQVATVPVLA